MKTVLPGIWILVLTLFSNIDCQDEFTAQDLLRLRQLSSSSNNADTVTGYNTNIVHRDPNTNEHSVSSVSVQFRMNEDPEAAEKSIEEYERANHGRSSDHKRKIFHIKNPFQREENGRQQDFDNFDSDTGASNQYASMQYSLPPEGFLNQMRAENQLLQQYSTSAPALSYATTPQPQFQYQTNPPVGYDNNQPQRNPLSQQSFNHFQSQDQNTHFNYLGSPSPYVSDGPSTQSPQVQYVSTPSPAGQYVGTQNSPTYVSSSAPSYLSSPSSQLQFLSSPSSQINTGPSDYGNRINELSGSTSYDNGANINIQIDHYNNAINGMRYPFNGQQQQYQNEVSSTTIAPPSSSMFPDRVQDWRSALNVGVDSLSKSVQELSNLQQFQTNTNSHQESSSNDQNSFNGETHRIGNNMQSSNNVMYNFIQPEYQNYNNIRTRTRDLEQETAQPEVYSHGDYGWKMNGKRHSSESSQGAGTYSHLRPQAMPLQSSQLSDSAYNKYLSTSQTNFQSESQKPQNINLGYSIGFNSNRGAVDDDFGGKSSSSENVDTHEFVKAAAKVHENMKMHQSQRVNEPYYGHDSSVASYAPSYPNNNFFGNTQSTGVVSTYYGNTDKQQRDGKYNMAPSTQTPYAYGYSQTDLVTAMPYLYGSLRNGNIDSKTKQPFDHAKALKNILPIDVSNVIYSQENAAKSIQNYANAQRLTSGQKEEMEQNLKQLLDHYKPLTDAYYKDKNTGYGFNIKAKPDNYVSSNDGTKSSELANFPSKHTTGETSFNQDYSFDSKRYADVRIPQVNYQQQASNTYTQNIAPTASMQQSSYRPQDFSNILKLNDVPYKLSQNSLSLGLGSLNSFDPSSIPQQIPTRINQNVGSHQLEPTNSLLSKLNLLTSNKQYGGAYRQGEVDPQSSGMYSTINGIRVANPFNVDLKLVSEMLKGKPAVDETRMIPLRDHFNRLLPIKLDMSSLQQILSKSENTQIPMQDLGAETRNKDFSNFEILSPLTAKFREVDSDHMSSGNSFVDAMSHSRYPYQGQVKYSRSQEEEESSIVPAADASNNHPIGAVIEQEDINLRESNGDSDLTGQGMEEPSSYNEHRPKLSPPFDLRDHRMTSSQRHPNNIYSGRHHYYRKYPKDENLSEPYPLLKPPRPPRSRISHFKNEKRSRRRRMPKIKSNRMLKTQPLFEAETPAEEAQENTPVPIVLRPPPLNAQSKSDEVTKDE